MKILDTFNHSSQTSLVYSSLSQQDIKAAFLVVNSCSYSRTWMLRRIEDDIKSSFNVKVQKENLSPQSSHISPPVETLKSRFQENFHPKNIEKILESEYLFLIINIDSYDLETLKILVQSFWQPLNKINTQKRDQAVGRILLFLVGSDQENNWQTQWRNHPILADSLAELTPAQPFNVNDLCGVISKSALQFGIILPNAITDFSETLLAKSDGSTQNLLKSFYQLCKCPSKDFIQQWQNYPS